MVTGPPSLLLPVGLLTAVGLPVAGVLLPAPAALHHRHGLRPALQECRLLPEGWHLGRPRPAPLPLLLSSRLQAERYELLLVVTVGALGVLDPRGSLLVANRGVDRGSVHRVPRLRVHGRSRGEEGGAGERVLLPGDWLEEGLPAEAADDRTSGVRTGQ